VVTDPPATGPLPLATPVTVKPATDKRDDGQVDQLVLLILGAAVLLGIGGISGLYLTRAKDEHGS